MNSFLRKMLVMDRKVDGINLDTYQKLEDIGHSA